MRYTAALHAASVVCALAAVVTPGHAISAEKIGRYVVEIKVDGHQNWQAGSDYAKSTTTEYYRIVTHVKSDGEPDSVNVKDPQFAQKQMAQAARVQQAVRKAQGRAPASTPATPEEYAAQQQKLAAQAQTEQAACKGDTACLMQMAMRYSQQSAAISYPVPGAAVATESVEEDAEDEARYLNYFGYEGCPTEISIRIDQRSEGAYADVAGMIPWTTTETADSRGTDLDRKMQCLGATTVFDLKSKMIYTDGFGVPAVRGRYLSKDGLHGETVNDNAEVSGSSEALEWVSQLLRQAPASGSRNTTLTPKSVMSGNAPNGAKLEGQIRVSVNWRFEP